MDKNLQLTEEQKLGLEIEKELEALFNSGKKEFEIDEIERIAPKTYDVLYDVCEEQDTENGIETSNFRLIESTTNETEDATFKIFKK
jgi:hypothetical protein